MASSRWLLGLCSGVGLVALLRCGGHAASSSGGALASGGGGAVGVGGGAGSRAAGGNGVGVAGASAGAGGGGAGASAGACGGPRSVAVGHPKESACPALPANQGYAGSADGVQCSTDADCQDAGSNPNADATTCLNRECVFGTCLVDSDCPRGQACECLNANPNVPGGNRCVSAQCRVDSDCGANGVCSADYSSPCGRVAVGYFCHSPADTCSTSSDCCGDTPTCAYQSALGHWACQAVAPCTG
jgi:hypothetical protein